MTTDQERQQVQAARERYDQAMADYVHAVHGGRYFTVGAAQSAAAMIGAEREMYRVTRLKAFHDQQRALNGD